MGDVDNDMVTNRQGKDIKIPSLLEGIEGIVIQIR